jgi:signal transduction histidine kinase
VWAAVRAVLTAPFAGRTWLEYLYLVAAAPLVLAGLVAIAIGLTTGAFLTITLIGIPLVAGTVLLARELGSLHRGLANGLLGTNVPAPRRARPKPGLFGWLKTSLLEVSGWRGMAYLVLATPFTVVGLYAVAIAWGMGLALLAYPVYWQVLEPTQTGPDGTVHRSAMQFGDYYIETWPRAIGVAAIGLAVLFVIPWIARTATGIDRLLVRGLLGPTRMSERVVDLEATRAQAVDASAAELRRIERDLHDGTQARLVALAMHLDMAKEKLAGVGPAPADPGVPGGDDDLVRARDLLDTAHRNATEAIVELRDVTRSIHPPALDRGLDAALATLAARSGVPATVRASIAVRPSPAIETIAYFCVAELLTNVAKHSGASRATVDVTGDGRLLRLRVSDDGRGGAALRPGGGLAGLAERVRTVDGRLDIASPAGGPTLVTVDLPSGS